MTEILDQTFLYALALFAWFKQVPGPGSADPLKIALAGAYVAIGLVLIALTVALLREKLPPHDPYREAFGEMPLVPDPALDRDRMSS